MCLTGLAGNPIRIALHCGDAAVPEAAIAATRPSQHCSATTALGRCSHLDQIADRPDEGSNSPQTSSKCGLSRCQPIPAPASILGCRIAPTGASPKASTHSIRNPVRLLKVLLAVVVPSAKGGHAQLALERAELEGLKCVAQPKGHGAWRYRGSRFAGANKLRALADLDRSDPDTAASAAAVAATSAAAAPPGAASAASAAVSAAAAPSSAAVSATTPTAAAAAVSVRGKLYAGRMCSGLFPIEDVEGC